MNIPALRWFRSPSGTIFLCLVAVDLHEHLGSPNGAVALVALFTRASVSASIGSWVLADARRRQRVLPYDFGTFVYFAWPVLVPIYLFTSRGWRGFVPIGAFLLLYLMAWLVSVLPWLLHVV